MLVVYFDVVARLSFRLAWEEAPSSLLVKVKEV